MGITTLAWVTVFCGSIALSFKRSSWAIIAYLMTVYTSPVYWWFGDPLEGFGLRWNLMGAVFFALACLVDRRKFPIDWSNKVMPIIGCYFLFCLNATIVHFTLADNVERSAYGLQLAWKQLILLTCLLVSLRDRFDVKLFAMAIASLSAYVAYEIIFKDAGTYDDGRLNKISIPQAVGSNELAGIFCIAICLGGYFVFFGASLRTKAIATVLTCLSLEVVLRTVSRAAFLSLFVAASFFIVSARGVSRRYAVSACVLAVMAAFFVMGKEHQEMALSRFFTSFNKAEERDVSAESRLNYWRAGMQMIADHPLGAGYESAFTSDLGVTYLMRMESDHHWYNRYRAVHNGYLDVTASWGIQGMTVFCLMLVIAFLRIRAGIKKSLERGDDSSAFLGNCLEAVILTQLVVVIFSSTLDAEWILWWVALAVGYEYTTVPALPMRRVAVRRATPAAVNRSATSP